MTHNICHCEPFFDNPSAGSGQAGHGSGHAPGRSNLLFIMSVRALLRLRSGQAPERSNLPFIMSLRALLRLRSGQAPERSNLLNGKIASSPLRAPRNDKLREGSSK
jgi:hypothetical protein